MGFEETSDKVLLKDDATENGQTMPIPAKEEVSASLPSVDTRPPDDELGDFGDSNAFGKMSEKMSPDSAPTEYNHQASSSEIGAPTSQPSAVTSSVNGEDGKFGDFSDFGTFEEAP